MSPRLSIAMIVRDEAKMITGFLDAVHGLWDELVAVDTGSTDDTIERLRAAGATVLHHPWHDDFAEARNKSLEAVTGDWVLVLDADERVTPEFTRELLGAIEQPGVGALTVRLSNALPYGHLREARLLRAFKADPAIRYRFAIHEDASASVAQSLARRGLTLGQVQAPITHLGYVRERAAAKNKRARDRRMLEALLAADPFDFYSHLKLLELARYWHDSLLQQQQAHAAIDALEQAGRASLAGQPWGGELIALVTESLFRAGSQAGLTFLAEWERSLSPSAPFFHQRAVMHEHLGHHAEARADYEKCLTLGDLLGDEQLTSVRPRLGLARLAIADGHPDAALTHAEAALEHGPRDPEALVAVATLTRALHGQAGLDEWEARHRLALPSCPERDWAVGEALYTLGEFKDAAARLRVAAGVPPGGPASVRLAQALLADGQLEQAEALSRTLAASEPEAGLGALLFDLLEGKQTTLDLELSPQTADAAMRHWVDALLASNNGQARRLLKARARAVSQAFPWLSEYLRRRAG